MRIFLIILVSFVVFGCQTNHYLSEPLKGIPPVAMQKGAISKGILLATNYNLKADTTDFEECLKGLKLNLKAKSTIKIMDELSFLKLPNAGILKELKAQYGVDGLLLLKRLDVQRKWYDIPSGKFEYIDNNMPEPFFEIIGVRNIPWTNVYVKITSQWEYHDFTNDITYLFSVKNEKVLELKEYIKDIDAYMNEYYSLFDPLFYQNGSMTASNIIDQTDVYSE